MGAGRPGPGPQGPYDDGLADVSCHRRTLSGVGCALDLWRCGDRCNPNSRQPNFWGRGLCVTAQPNFTYVGEAFAAFLLSTPAHPLEREHKIRWGDGENGLRPESVGKAFVNRFKHSPYH